jgi:hypothetical protein
MALRYTILFGTVSDKHFLSRYNAKGNTKDNTYYISFQRASANLAEAFLPPGLNVIYAGRSWMRRAYACRKCTENRMG